MLFAIWADGTHRPTRDLDLLGFGTNDNEELKRIFAELCEMAIEPDGLRFLAESVTAEPIREEAAYPGTRVTLEARLENARVSLQVDIGFGDVVTPAPEEVDFPALLDFAAPHLRAYPIYTVVSEKLEATVRLGEANTRMKDFFDLWFLCRKFSFDGELLRNAITRTFARRDMELPPTLPASLTADFAERKATTWAVFVRRNGLDHLDLKIALEEIHAFAWPVLAAAGGASAFELSWNPEQGWRPGGRV